MSAQTKKGSKKQNTMTETGIKVGKALARTSVKAEKSTRKVKQMAEDLLDSVTGIKIAVPKTNQTPPPPRPYPLPLSPVAGLSVEGHLGFLAGDLYQILEADGETTTKKLVSTLKKRSHSEAMIYAAIGWLAREGRVTFTPDGKSLMLR